ncbi:hypothetical protein IU450_32760 [Nocardia abscessus]|uniref:hypothetical protein n=1 Tax=Nocardia abscessus TaxID=120957 RepID=UPI00189500E2|nr:hypothetical protein [Nocardia abscessus]MBF6340633.1 hypothetical protein [Nocardia abscessus]
MNYHKEPESGEDDRWAWLDQPRTGPDLRLVPSPDPGLDSETGAEPGSRISMRRDRWLVAVAQTPDAPDTGVGVLGRINARERVSWRVWAALAASVAVMIGLVAVGASDTRDAGDRLSATALPPSATSAAEGACTGLSGTTVTDRRADTTATVAGVIAAFEAAYYIDRSAEAAMRLLAPESGIAADGLAAGIASIPAGATHCVAVTPISESTANVHVVELRPDRQRMDYLQLINTRPGEGGGLLISNVQRQG